MALDEQQNLKTVIETALRKYIQRRQRRKITELFGTIDDNKTYDYKAQRHLFQTSSFDTRRLHNRRGILQYSVGVMAFKGRIQIF